MHKTTIRVVVIVLSVLIAASSVTMGDDALLQTDPTDSIPVGQLEVIATNEFDLYAGPGRSSACRSIQ